MDPALATLIRELKTLRKGRALFVRQIGERIGPALRASARISDTDAPSLIRRKVSEHLETLASSLPEDLGIAVLGAFALHPEARLPFYQERTRWVAQVLHRDDRTARRRIDEGIARLAELALSTEAGPGELSTTGWHTQELRISLALDQPHPEALELRRIVANQDNLRVLDLAITLTQPPGHAHPHTLNELSIDVFHGGQVVGKQLESPDRVGYSLVLPRPLNRDDQHDFALRYRIRHKPIQPHYVCVPRHRCDRFDLHIRFAEGELPTQVWRLSDAFQRDIDDPTPAGQDLIPDAAGEVHTTFRRLTPGLAYGIRWT